MNILVIGASAAGLKAACRARRLLADAKVTVLEEGEYIAWAGCGLPYYLSSDIDNFRSLTKTAYDVVKDVDYFAQAKDVQVLTGVRAESIDSKNKTVQALNLKTNQRQTFRYDVLVLATGSRPAIPAIAGLRSPGVYNFTRPEDALILRQAAEKNQISRVAIIGAGYIGCELCEAFRALWGIEAELFEETDQVLSSILDPEMARIVELELLRRGIGVHLGVRIDAIGKSGKKLTVSSAGAPYGEFDRVIIAAGVQPRSDLAAVAELKVGSTGGIFVDSRLCTSDPHIFAAGDCVEVTHHITGRPCHLPLGSLANRMGRIVGNVIGGQDDWLSPVCGSACLKVFDLNIAAVGLTANAAAAAGFKVGRSWGSFTDKSHYYPESKMISATMVFDSAERRLLGVQVVGTGDVVGRIDAASVMIQDNRTVGQIYDYEPAYAPPYNSPLDPLHYLAYAALSALDEGILAVPPGDLSKAALDSTILDVREPSEVNEAPFSLPCRKSLNIPFLQIRRKVAELPKHDKFIVVCQRGTRSSEVVRILKQGGFADARYLGGGLGFYLN